MANGQITDSEWPTCLSANPGDQAANLARPFHLNPRLARQAVQPDPAPGGVEVSPILAVYLDGGDRGGGRVAQNQHHLARRVSRWQGYRGHEAVVLNVRYQLIADRAKMGRGVSHRDSLSLLKPGPGRRARQPQHIDF